MKLKLISATEQNTSGNQSRYITSQNLDVLKHFRRIEIKISLKYDFSLQNLAHVPLWSRLLKGCPLKADT